MPSAYTVIKDGNELLSAAGDKDKDIVFDAPGILQKPSVLFYRVYPSDDLVTLRLEINEKKVHDASWREETRTYHEVVGVNVVKAIGNKLTLTFLGSSGSISVSDIVLLYQQ